MCWLMPYRHKYIYSTTTIFFLDILKWNIIALISDVLQVACDIMPLNKQVLNDNEQFIPYLYPLILVWFPPGLQESSVLIGGHMLC